MKKSKIILLCKIALIILCTLNIISVVFLVKKKYFNIDKLHNKGVVTSIDKKSNKTKIIIKSNKKILAYISDNKASPEVGDVIQFNYKFKEINTSGIFNTFSYKDYLKGINVRNVIDVLSYNKVGESIFYKLKNKLLKKVESKKSYKYINTFLFSNRSFLDDSVKDSYNKNGISHMLCVSGFHVLFLINMLKVIFRKLKAKRNITSIFIFTFSITYLFLSDFQIALTRAFVLYFFNEINKKYNLKINKYLIFFLVLNICLFNKTYLIYSSSFWYTFTLSFFLICSNNDKNNHFRNKVYLSIYMFLVSLPLTIYFNYEVNFLTIIHNLLFLYVVCYLIYPLTFAAIFIPFIDIVLYKISLLFEFINIKLSRINIFRIIIPKTSIIFIIFLYLILLLFLKYKSKKILICYLFVLVFIKCSIFLDKSSYLYFLNVSQGDMAIYISNNARSVTLIDTGGIKQNKYLFNNIKTFLYSKGVTTINSLIISHGDFDHMGEAINLVNNFKVEKVIFNCGPYNDLEKELIKVLDKKKIKYYSCIKELNIDKNKLYFLQTKVYDNENDNSNVIYTELNGYKFMFIGDASTTTEKEIIDKYNLPDVDVLKVGHHGSKTSSGKDFIDEINPRYSVISVGKNNRYGHPNKEVLNNLENSKIYRTDQDGSIMFKIKNSKLKIETCTQ